MLGCSLSAWERCCAPSNTDVFDCQKQHRKSNDIKTSSSETEAHHSRFKRWRRALASQIRIRKNKYGSEAPAISARRDQGKLHKTTERLKNRTQMIEAEAG